MKSVLDNLEGQTFGRLLVKARAPNRIKKVYWVCECTCGNIREVYSQSLKRGLTISCGCYNKQRVIETKSKHNHAKAGEHTLTYYTWINMKTRCYNPKFKQYYDYGGRGVKVCNRWKDSFENFLEDMGEKKIGLTLDRINNDGNYEPSNCRWVTFKEQNNNRRSRKRRTV